MNFTPVDTDQQAIPKSAQQKGYMIIKSTGIFAGEKASKLGILSKMHRKHGSSLRF